MKYQIVHIEDDDGMRMVIEKTLEKLKLDIALESISTACAGLQRLRNAEPVDLIISDFNFAGEHQDGADVRAVAKECRANVPFILFSSGARNPDDCPRFDALTEDPGVHWLEKGCFTGEGINMVVARLLKT